MNPQRQPYPYVYTAFIFRVLQEIEMDASGTRQKITGLGDAVNPYDAVSKTVMDSAISAALCNLDWQDSVLDKDLTAPPGSPSTGDRYIVASPATGAWSGHEDDIAEWNGASWDFTTPNEGFACEVEDEDSVYYFNGTSWVNLEGILDHAKLKNRAWSVAGHTIDDDVYMNSNQIKGLAAPTDSEDAAHKSYVDAQHLYDSVYGALISGGYWGFVVYDVAGEALADGDVCEYRSDGKWYKADASALSTCDGRLAINIFAKSGDGEGLFLLWGLYRNTSWSWSIDDKLYIGTTAGAIVTTAPSHPNIVKQIGIAFATDIIGFFPDTKTDSANHSKAGIIAPGSFTGTPRKATITFNTAMPDNNYAISIVGEDARNWSIESKTSAGFTVNSGSGAVLSGNTFWTTKVNRDP